jgi:hypothetical protein
MLATNVAAQSFDQLTPVKNTNITAYYSDGHQQRAEAMALRVEKAMTFHEQLLGFRPVVTLLVLSPGDWSKFSKSGAVYGMPHYTNDKTLIVAAEDNAFWKSFIPPMDKLPPALWEKVSTVYATADGHLSMQGFFDLLAIHELAHAFHLQDSLTMQRRWMGELFANIFLHTYIAENDPASLPALTLFPEMVVASGAKGFLYTSLYDVHEKYGEIAQRHPKNYGWYQCRWHIASATIYNAGGKKVCKELWNALKMKKEILPDDALIGFLRTTVDKSLSDMISNWDIDTVR